MPRRLRDAVVVITGASSGIGRATALACAERRAAVVVAARREQPLRELASECEQLGGRSLAVPVDVMDHAAVESLARRAVETFGRIDVWINNAAVTLFGRFEESPLDVYRRVIETNLFGYIHGAHAALPYFREQGSGVLINNASVVATVGQAYATAYATSKWAIRGFSDSLRQEFFDAPDIHVCTVLPASIDTPLFQHGANYTGRAVKPLPPVYDPEQVARAMVSLAEHPRRELFVGGAGRLLALQHTLAPGLTERLYALAVEKLHFQDRPAPPTPGNVFGPMAEGVGVRGGWKARGVVGGSQVRRVATVGAAALVPTLAAWLLARPKRKARRASPLTRSVASLLR